MSWEGKESFLKTASETFRKKGFGELRAIRDKPRLTMFDRPFWDAFVLAGNSRTIGFGTIGRIPVSEISSVITELGIVGIDDRLEYIDCITSMDSRYIELTMERIHSKPSKRNK